MTNAVTNAVQSTVQQVQQTVAEVKAKVQEAPRPPAFTRDSFEQLPRPKVDLGAICFTPSARADSSGVHASLKLNAGRASLTLASFSVGPGRLSVSDGRTTVSQTDTGGLGVSTRVLGQKVGAHVKTREGAATLGAIDLKLAGQEVVIGLVPAAPSPIPMPMYVGPERTDGSQGEG